MKSRVTKREAQRNASFAERALSRFESLAAFPCRSADRRELPYFLCGKLATAVSKSLNASGVFFSTSSACQLSFWLLNHRSETFVPFSPYRTLDLTFAEDVRNAELVTDLVEHFRIGDVIILEEDDKKEYISFYERGYKHQKYPPMPDYFSAKTPNPKEGQLQTVRKELIQFCERVIGE